MTCWILLLLMLHYDYAGRCIRHTTDPAVISRLEYMFQWLLRLCALPSTNKRERSGKLKLMIVKRFAYKFPMSLDRWITVSYPTWCSVTSTKSLIGSTSILIWRWEIIVIYGDVNKKEINFKNWIFIYWFLYRKACVLARARCSAFNPITGELQQQLPAVYSVGQTNNVGTAGYFSSNALQISPLGDIRIIAFPGNIGVGNLFCSSNSNLDQSTYDSQTCLIG